MAISERERLFEDWAAAWSSPGNAEKLVSLFTDDCVYEDVTMGIVNHGKRELENFYNFIYDAFPDFKVELRSYFVAGSWAGAEWLMAGTHKGDLPGLPATNKSCAIRGSTIFELQGDKIRRNSDYWDMVTFLKQVGVMPSA